MIGLPKIDEMPEPAPMVRRIPHNEADSDDEIDAVIKKWVNRVEQYD